MNSTLLLTVHDRACFTNPHTVCQVYIVTSSLLEQGIKMHPIALWNVCDDILWNRFWIQITGNGIPNDRKATLQSFCPVMMTQDSLRLSKGTLALYHAATRPQHSYLLYICHRIAACLQHMWEHHRPRHFTDFFVAHFVSFRAYTALSHSWIYWLCKAAYNHGHLFQSCQLN